MAKKARKVSVYEIADQLADMPRLENIEEFGPLILALMKGLPRNVFTELDEKPGKFEYMRDRFYMLRQVRNSPEWGKKMFAGFV